MSKKADDLWLKAAVVGGLWASLEIIVGSFLHNTRLPFAGSMLAFAGTILLIGFYQVWPTRGLIIRAGLITAIMKSVSPSAIILGPMMGIMLEAILLELMIMLFGNNRFGLIIAGIASVSSALFYKLFSLLIFFGFDLIKVYVNIVNFALKQFGIPEAEPVEILLALLCVYAIFGIIAGTMGYYIGNKAIQYQKNSDEFKIEKKPQKEEAFFEFKKGQQTSFLMLLIHIISVPAGLYLINMEGTNAGFVFAAFYILAIGFIYRHALRRLRKPFFWLQLLFIVLLTSIFWDIGNDDSQWFNMEGFWVGVEMVFRAIFIIVAFSAISVELRNDKVRNFIFNVGIGKFYESVGMAFSALPMMIGFLPSSKEIVRHPLRSLLKPLVMADEWLYVLKKKN
jgi:hypothetical protein